MRRFDRPGRSPVHAENGMAATSHPLATIAALDILKRGGNAVDAAVAASATLCVVEPHMTGIGGDCFAIVAQPDGSLHGLNGSGRAPAAADADWYRARGFRNIPETGPHAVTVPGAIKAWETLLERFGTMPFEALFAQAIRYAEEGFPIHPRVGWDWARQVEALAADEGGRRHYLLDGKAPGVGARQRQPALAGTLRAIARNGSKAFYEGEIGAEIAATVRGLGGLLTEDDLAAVSADWVEPISASFARHEVFEIPPNGQGITALIMFRLLETIGPAADPDSAERWHLEVEAGRLAYSVRDHLVADPATMTVAPEELLSESFIAALAGRIDRRRRNPEVSLPAMPRSDTIYLTVVDRDRRAISFINSTYEAFGSKIVTPHSGIALQNRGACFSLEKGHPNEIGPGKRPMHTIIPAMAMLDGLPAVSFGVMGGAYQPMGHVQAFSNLAAYGMDPQEAIDHPRLFWSEDDDVLEAESGIPDSVRRRLAGMGHAIRDAERPHGGGQMIVIDRRNGFLIGGSDPRKDGIAAGW